MRWWLLLQSRFVRRIVRVIAETESVVCGELMNRYRVMLYFHIQHGVGCSIRRDLVADRLTVERTGKSRGLIISVTLLWSSCTGLC